MIKLMSETGYDAAALSNHDFDAGTHELVQQLPGSKFPFVNCHYNFSDTLLHDKILQHKKFSV